MSQFDDFVGRSRIADDTLDPWRAQALAALLSRDVMLRSHDRLPMLWQWIYFLPIALMQETGKDGHPRRGDFLPPITLQRRMFAGGRSTVTQPLRLGLPARRTETIERIEEKQGKNGPMLLVKVSHRFEQEGVTCLHEEQDYIYLEPPSTKAQQPALETIPDAPLSEQFTPDPVLLFRFSALSYNGHRIHYDRSYACNEEGYPDLVVHGPLTAIMLAGLAEAGRSPLSFFSFRAQRPLFCQRPVSLRGSIDDAGSVLLSAHDDDGAIAVTAKAQS